MLKKRLIFTLLYDRGTFMLSRNFRLQGIGGINWLEQNYVFENVSAAVDEIVVLDVSRGGPDHESFRAAVKRLTRTCFIPISAGGWVRRVDDAVTLLRSGADKIVVNTVVVSDPEFVRTLASTFGRQCVVAAIDLTNSSGRWRVHVEQGETVVGEDADDVLRRALQAPIGDLYLNSIDRDGTGQGYHLEMLDLLPAELSTPVIIAGGAGNSAHLEAGLRDHRVDAVATAHLLNFVGDGLIKARTNLITSGIALPERDWDIRQLRVPS